MYYYPYMCQCPHCTHAQMYNYGGPSSYWTQSGHTTQGHMKLKDYGKKLDLKLINKNDKFNIKFRDLIDDLKMDIEKIDLEVEVGTENAMITAFLVTAISTFLSILLRKQIKDKNKPKNIIVFKIKNIKKSILRK